MVPASHKQILKFRKKEAKSNVLLRKETMNKLVVDLLLMSYVRHMYINVCNVRDARKRKQFRRHPCAYQAHQKKNMMH